MVWQVERLIEAMNQFKKKKCCVLSITNSPAVNFGENIGLEISAGVQCPCIWAERRKRKTCILTSDANLQASAQSILCWFAGAHLTQTSRACPQLILCKMPSQFAEMNFQTRSSIEVVTIICSTKSKLLIWRVPEIFPYSYACIRTWAHRLSEGSHLRSWC